MENTNILKSSLILKYEYGVDSKGEPKTVTQKFSKINSKTDLEAFKLVGNALGALIDSEQVLVNQEQLISLADIETK